MGGIFAYLGAPIRNEEAIDGAVLMAAGEQCNGRRLMLNWYQKL
jgi:hypothetical protein